MKKPKEKPIVLVQTIMDACCAKYNITFGQLSGDSHKPEYSLPRQIAMTLTRELTNLSYPEIGHLFQRNHSTVMSSVRRVYLLERRKPELTVELNALRWELAGTLQKTP